MTKTARSQKQSIGVFRDPFKLVPVNDIAGIADKLTRNEILTSNEMRSVLGYRPSSDPNSDILRNKNLNASNSQSNNTGVSNNTGTGEPLNDNNNKGGIIKDAKIKI